MHQLLENMSARFVGLTELFKSKTTAEDLYVSLDNAIVEIRKRQNDGELRRRVELYLGEDIPHYFKNPPILYMARHIVTPNFETLRFLHVLEPLNLPIIIGYDPQDKFVTQNKFKRALGKLPIYRGASQKGNRYLERYEKIAIIDFNKANGKCFDSIRTLWEQPLTDFHKEMFDHITKVPLTIADESSWIDRQHRGDIVSHYKKFLALFVVHGILFEDYMHNDPEEAIFIKKVLCPAFFHIEKIFGVRPLLVKLTPRGVESENFWMSYPNKVRNLIHERLKNAPARISG